MRSDLLPRTGRRSAKENEAAVSPDDSTNGNGTGAQKTAHGGGSQKSHLHTNPNPANVARADDGCDTKRGCPITRAPSYLFPEPERYSARCGLMPRASSSSCAAEMVEGESIITSRPELFLGNAM